MTPLSIINGALRSLGALASGETAEPNTANDAFNTLNDMLDQWSNERMMLFCIQEVIHEITASQYIYTIGPGGQLGCTISGSISGTVLTVSALSAGAIHVGQTLTGSGITSGTTIISYGTGTGGNGVGAIGTYNLSQSSTTGAITITGTTVRPLRINSAIVRVNNSLTGTLDYPVSVINLEQYELIGIKTLAGPWPRAVYYQPSEPVGVLNYWPNPSKGEMHLYCDTVLNSFQTLNDNVILPQGFAMALRFNLAMILAPEFGKNDPTQLQMIGKLALDGKSLIKRTNMNPQQPSRFDDALMSGRFNDAGFILHGGFL